MTRRRHGAGDRPETGTRTRASGAGRRQPGRGEPSHAAGDDASREALVWADSAVQRPVRLLVLFDCPVGPYRVAASLRRVLPTALGSRMDRCSAVRVERFVERDAE